MQRVKEYIYRKLNSLPPQTAHGQLPESLLAYRCFCFVVFSFFGNLPFSNKKRITVRSEVENIFSRTKKMK